MFGSNIESMYNSKQKNIQHKMQLITRTSNSTMHNLLVLGLQETMKSLHLDLFCKQSIYKYAFLQKNSNHNKIVTTS